MSYTHPSSWFEVNTRQPLNHDTAKPLIVDMLGSDCFTETPSGCGFSFPQVISRNHIGLYEVVGKHLADFLNANGITCQYQPGLLAFLNHTRRTLEAALAKNYCEHEALEMLAGEIKRMNI